MDTEITVIGAGVIGLAIAARLSEEISPVFVIEKHKKFGQETSSRNSEVIHSGIYYPTKSLKAKLCIRGKEMLYQYCDENDIPYRKCGKMIVAEHPDEKAALEQLLNQAAENGVTDATYIGYEEMIALEPHVSGACAAWFPTSGILDTHSFMQSLENRAIHNGVSFAYAHETTGIRKLDNGYLLEVKQSDGSSFSFTSKAVVNASGLTADKTAALAGITDPSYTQYFWKGEYFTLIHGLHKRINRLIYQLPERHTVGLGIHTTPDIHGRMRLGPNTLFLADGKPDYRVDPSHAKEFQQSVRRFLPFITVDDLTPDQAGIRPKLQQPGSPWRDFIIREEKERGFPGFVNLIGIESPGLTASLSIARYVQQLLYGIPDGAN